MYILAYIIYMINKEKAMRSEMTTLRHEDLVAIAKEIGEDWEFAHPGCEAPRGLTVDIEAVDEDEELFELQVIRHLPREA